MAVAIEVVLREMVNKLGHPGDVVRVKPGFARNFLIPKGLAVVASQGNLRQVEHEKEQAKRRADKLQADAQAAAERLSGAVLEVAMPVGETDRLFGALTTKDIAGLLHAKGFEIDKRQILISQPIKQLGEHTVEVRLAPTVVASVKINVVREG